ncbi:50S ribosomal protein L1 [Candidatus Geothermarchaeota archaeon]|nr:MAG: 50S ribosomal protein L1 [Candidatus Geothermarchaeota archaeon]
MNGDTPLSFIPRENIVDAVRKALELAPKKKFKQAVELIVVLRDVDIKSPEGRIREIIFLPKKITKDIKICVAADGEMALKAKNAGAFMVLTREDLQKLMGNRKEAKKIAQQCDWVLVRADLMPITGRALGPALGPRGKIPVPVPPAANIEALIEKYKSAILIRTKDQAQIMCRVGVENMDPNDIAENIITVLTTLEGKLKNPRYNIAKVIVKTTMGLPVEVKIT